MRLRQIWSRNRLENHSATKGKKSQTSRKSCHRKKERRAFRVLSPIFGRAGQQVTRVYIVSEKLWIMKGTQKLSWPYVYYFASYLVGTYEVTSYPPKTKRTGRCIIGHRFLLFAFCGVANATLKMRLESFLGGNDKRSHGFRRWCRDEDPAYSRRRNNIYCFTRATKFIAFLAR